MRLNKTKKQSLKKYKIKTKELKTIKINFKNKDKSDKE